VKRTGKGEDAIPTIGRPSFLPALQTNLFIDVLIGSALSGNALKLEKLTTSIKEIKEKESNSANQIQVRPL
jgi:hypothetical protein